MLTVLALLELITPFRTLMGKLFDVGLGSLRCFETAL
jgi:hypothetical protein